jgi:hypothetical protein
MEKSHRLLVKAVKRIDQSCKAGTKGPEHLENTAMVSRCKFPQFAEALFLGLFLSLNNRA